MANKILVVESSMTDGFVVESQVRGHRIVIDQPAAAGGTEAGPSPLEMLLAALAGCLATLARLIAMQRRLSLRSMQLRVEGDIDYDGLLGKAPDIRVGFESIVVKVSLDTDMTPAEQVAFLRELERRCPVSENLLNTTPMSVQLA